MSVLTLADAKRHLGKSASVTTDDVELQSVIDAAEAAIGSRTGPLQPTAVTSRVRGQAPNLLLPVTPVISLTSVVAVNGGDTINVADLTVQSSGVVEFIIGWGVAWARFWLPYYDVTYQAGRATCPPDLLFGVKELVRHLWDTQRGRARGPGLDSVGSGAQPADVVGAAYLLIYRVMESIAPYMQSGIS